MINWQGKKTNLVTEYGNIMFCAWHDGWLSVDWKKLFLPVIMSEDHYSITSDNIKCDAVIGNNTERMMIAHEDKEMEKNSYSTLQAGQSNERETKIIESCEQTSPTCFFSSQSSKSRELVDVLRFLQSLFLSVSIDFFSSHSFLWTMIHLKMKDRTAFIAENP